MVLTILDKYREVKNRDRFILPEDKDISLFIKAIEDVINLLKDVDENVNVEEYTEEEKIEKVKERKQLYYETNKEYISENAQIYRDEHKDEIALTNKIYYENNKEEYAKKNKVYRDNNKEKIAAHEKIYYEDNKEELNIKTKIWKENNKDRVIEKSKQYREENRDEILKKNKIKVTCECGAILNAPGMSRHVKTETHQKFINEINEIKNKVEIEIELEVENNTETCEENIAFETETISEDEIESKEEDINKRERNTEKIVCECGVKIVKWSLNRHIKAKIHENLMKLKT